MSSCSRSDFPLNPSERFLGSLGFGYTQIVHSLFAMFYYEMEC